MTKTTVSIFLLLVAFMHSLNANLENKINSTKTDIKKQKIKEKGISKKLNQIAIDISKEEQRLTKINKDILGTKRKIKQQNKKSNIKKGELRKIKKLYETLGEREKTVNKKMTDILSKGISLEMITNNTNNNETNHSLYENSIDNIILKEMFNTYSTILKNKFSKTKKRYIKLRKNITIVKSELDKIKFKLNDLKSQINKYDKLKNLKTKTLKNLDSQKSAYFHKLNRIKREKEALSSTLKKLNITKIQRNKTIIRSTSSDTSVRQIGSSYQASALAKYRGPKTIAPLERYTVAQNFGTYIDPIYKMKIFNEAVILRSNSKNARIKNVLDGKVIYADKTSMLEYVVIVKNKNNIHTIFAHLSQIAPTIKVGKKIPKGYVLGRINRELTFEVTQNDKHINPMRLIK